MGAQGQGQDMLHFFADSETLLPRTVDTASNAGCYTC